MQQRRRRIRRFPAPSSTPSLLMRKEWPLSVHDPRAHTHDHRGAHVCVRCRRFCGVAFEAAALRALRIASSFLPRWAIFPPMPLLSREGDVAVTVVDVLYSARAIAIEVSGAAVHTHSACLWPSPSCVRCVCVFLERDDETPVSPYLLSHCLCLPLPPLPHRPVSGFFFPFAGLPPPGD